MSDYSKTTWANGVSPAINATNLNKLEQGVVDNAKIIDYTATIPFADWTGAEAPFTKEVAVNGILAADKPIIDLVPSGTYLTDVAMADDWGQVYRITTAADSITVYAHEVPSADIPIALKAVR